MIDIDIQISISERSSGWATNYHPTHMTENFIKRKMSDDELARANLKTL